MKKIEATIRSEKIAAVLRALEVIGCREPLVLNARRRSARRSKVTSVSAGVALMPRIRVELVAEDAEVEQVVGAILATARTGEAGDGRILVSPLESIIRIRNGERGAWAMEDLD